VRTLEYRKPYKVKRTKLGVAEMVHQPADHCLEKSSCCITKLGIVMIFEMSWKHNHGRDYFTLFQTVLNGMIYSAYLSEANLSDFQAKWMATHFIKNINHAH
jgi:hypothetical protein